MPKLSIITINYNNKKGLLKTVKSVIKQEFNDCEYIIIDGGSTDGSIDIIKEYSNLISYWVSEHDRGIYHAMNKGIVRASGEYILFLNSGDFLVSDILSSLKFADLKEDIIYFNLEFLERNGSHIQVYPSTLSFRYLSTYSLPHQGALIKMDLFKKYGYYNENYSIVSDWSFFLITIAKHNATYKHINITFASVEREGISCDPQNNEMINLERQQVLLSEFNLFLEDYKHYYELERQSLKLKNNRLFRLLNKLINFI
ncbi:glycosyltransferase [Pontibacter sp. BT310]|uniref:Glycosyltransferase n=1 Tax=Pontibacter populi TaxID=890055 RepID=A0ABS6XFF6_9BACT|nr:MULTISPECIES: glycosyltransferase family 2 protein [Pontibacter]MBJ6119794.1 glycosyltransferase [Pontibacter sp. BT310]MBR0572223.1 glycosyltransferase [Microvirga sp. STS03]MBW3366647.1 glycosyltransferase [Pontibacter populi]